MFYPKKAFLGKSISYSFFLFLNLASIGQPFTSILIHNMIKYHSQFFFSASLKRPTLPFAHLSLKQHATHWKGVFIDTKYRYLACHSPFLIIMTKMKVFSIYQLQFFEPIRLGWKIMQQSGRKAESKINLNANGILKIVLISILYQKFILEKELIFLFLIFND